MKTNKERFKEAYTANLLKAVQKYPDEYRYDSDQVYIVVDKMMIAIEKGCFNKDGYSIKWTCKDLNIPYTYKGIAEFIKS